jgi:hypothetical protein
MRRNNTYRRNGAAIAALFLAGSLAGERAAHAWQRSAPSRTARPGRSRAAGPEEEAQKLLQRMFQAETSLAVAGREATFSMIGGGRESEQIVKRDPKRGLRLEFVRPAGDLLVDDFRRSWFLSHNGRRLVERESRLVELRKGIRDVTRQIKVGALSARVVGEDVVAGRPCVIVLVSPPPAEGVGPVVPSRRFWIDRETGLRLKTEEIGPMGRVLSSTYFLQVDVHPRFDETDFAPPPLPSGFVKESAERQTFPTVEAAQKMVRFALRKPGYLPPGFDLRHVAVAQLKGNRVVVQRYANGMSGVTLFQTDGANLPALGDHRRGGGRRGGPFSGGPPPPGRDGFGRGPRVRTWRDGGISFVLIGNLPDDQMKRIADSVR